MSKMANVLPPLSALLLPPALKTTQPNTQRVSAGHPKLADFCTRCNFFKVSHSRKKREVLDRTQERETVDSPRGEFFKTLWNNDTPGKMTKAQTPTR